jgi:hypothetical protein
MKEMRLPKGKVVNKHELHSSQAARVVRKDFYESIERWLRNEVESKATEQEEDPNLLGLAILITDELLHLTRIDGKNVVNFPGIKDAAKQVFNFVVQEYDRIDDSLRRRHRAFRRDLEDLEFTAVKDRKVFQGYLQDLAHSEEYYFIARKAKHIAETLSEIEVSYLKDEEENGDGR